jgi:hypothetical protein
MSGDPLSPAKLEVFGHGGYICYRGKEPSVNNELRLGGMTIEKQ